MSRPYPHPNPLPPPAGEGILFLVVCGVCALFTALAALLQGDVGGRGTANIKQGTLTTNSQKQDALPLEGEGQGEGVKHSNFGRIWVLSEFHAAPNGKITNSNRTQSSFQENRAHRRSISLKIVTACTAMSCFFARLPETFDLAIIPDENEPPETLKEIKRRFV